MLHDTPRYLLDAADERTPEANALLVMLQETLRNLDEEHRERLTRTRRSAQGPAIAADVAARLGRRHEERRAPYVAAIARLAHTRARRVA